MHTTDIPLQGALDYSSARAAAQPLAEQAGGEAMLLAWFDAKYTAGHPAMQECTGKKPGWLAFAENHGGNLALNINGGEFILILATGLYKQGD